MEAPSSRSSIVAMKVASLPSNSTSETTAFLTSWVFTVKPSGADELSGETAEATAAAVSAFSYSSVIVALKFLAPKLLADQDVGGFNEVLCLVQGHLSACGYIMPATFTCQWLRC